MRWCGKRRKMVSFTGGTESGRRIARIAAEKLMPVGLELGGKSPHVVFADANLEAAAAAVVGGIFEATDQSCVAGSRLFVERKVYERVLALVAARASAGRSTCRTRPGRKWGRFPLSLTANGWNALWIRPEAKAAPSSPAGRARTIPGWPPVRFISRPWSAVSPTRPRCPSRDLRACFCASLRRRG